MKIIIEDEDIKEVKQMAFEYLDIVLTDEHTRTLIEKNIDLQVEILRGGDDLDEELNNALVKWIMKEVPREGRRWNWPTYGDNDEYKKKFRAKFAEAAENLGVKLRKSWFKDERPKPETISLFEIAPCPGDKNEDTNTKPAS